MYANQINMPNATAILDTNSTSFYDCSTYEFVTLLQLFGIPDFKDILISKYDSYLELLIVAKKTSCIYRRIKNMEKVYSILEQIDGVHYKYISNSLRKFKDYDYLTILCSLNAINQ